MTQPILTNAGPTDLSPPAPAAPEAPTPSILRQGPEPGVVRPAQNGVLKEGSDRTGMAALDSDEPPLPEEAPRDPKPEAEAAPAADPLDVAERAARAKIRRTAEGRRARQQAQSESERAAHAERQLQGFREQTANEQALMNALRSPDPTVKARALQALGWGEQDAARYLVEQNTPEGRMAALEARLGVERQARAELEGRLARENEARVRRDTEAKYIDAAYEERTFKGSDAPVPTYPNLVALPKSAVLALGRDLVQETRAAWVARIGERGAEQKMAGITDADILAHLDRTIGQHSRKSGKTQASASPDRSTPAGAKGSKTQPLSRTVSSADKSDAVTSGRTLDQLSKAEQESVLVNVLRQSRR